MRCTLANVSVCLLCGLLPCLVANHRAAAGDDATLAAPRYRLESGQELVYQLKSEKVSRRAADDAVRPRPRQESMLQWNVFVLRRNEDGSWRLVIRKSEKRLEHRAGDDKPTWEEIGRAALFGKTVPKAGEAFARFSNVFIGYCDLHPDGRYEMNSSLGGHPSFEIQPEELFCRLPVDAEALRNELKYVAPASDNEFSLRLTKSDASHWEMCGRRVAQEDVVYQVRRNVCYRFDAERGCVDRITDDWLVETSKYRRQAAVELTEVRKHDAEWMKKFAAEADAYHATIQKSNGLLEEAHVARSVAECMAALTDARKLLTEGQAGADFEQVAEAYHAAIALHDRDFLGTMRSAASRESLYAQPPIDWETTDLTGRRRQSAEFRGKVVVMDFWYRGCGHCIKAMPKIKRLAAKYEGQPVAVLGMSNDENTDDAQSVIDTMEIKYPVFRCGELVEHYGVDGWPTFVVLDQQGRVALRTFGNSENLEQTLSDAVGKLLASPPE